VNGSRPQDGAKSSGISKRVVQEAYQRVKASKGAPGVDGVSIGQSGQDLKGNLYKLRGSHVVRLVLPPGGQGRGDP
jgi:retron-type reverse transcriptase